MKNMTKIAVFIVLVLALSPFAGFWIVALVGAGLILLPASAVVSTFFPKTWHRIEESLFDQTHVMPTP
ncbi:MAG: hypothetical protein IPK63_22550 [Candidatus Competibacteraceae bacterium]|nr:hypothetical protein [Candidatus Competibacteraceae bacterium]